MTTARGLSEQRPSKCGSAPQVASRGSILVIVPVELHGQVHLLHRQSAVAILVDSVKEHVNVLEILLLHDALLQHEVNSELGAADAPVVVLVDPAEVLHADPEPPHPVRLLELAPPEAGLGQEVHPREDPEVHPKQAEDAPAPGLWRVVAEPRGGEGDHRHIEGLAEALRRATRAAAVFADATLDPRGAVGTTAGLPQGEEDCTAEDEEEVQEDGNQQRVVRPAALLRRLGVGDVLHQPGLQSP
mmetsp:Transcript_98900/g.275280  ORF Transcript_98900/g.275280 Transcript_98900/m.275280 type:complete len:244 (-) Transcript_98900:505-1236(-)